MKCSEYLWNMCKMGIEHPGMSPEERTGRTAELLPKGEKIISDTTGEAMTQHDWGPVFGRNEAELWAAARADDRAAFDAIVLAQLGRDDEYDAEKSEETDEGTEA